MEDKNRPFMAAHFLVEIDTKGVGFARQVQGAGMANEPLVFKHASTQTQTVQGGKLKYTDLTIQAGMGFSPVFYDKIAKFIRREGVPINGAVVTGDFIQERSRRTFLTARSSVASRAGRNGTDSLPPATIVRARCLLKGDEKSPIEDSLPTGNLALAELHAADRRARERDVAMLQDRRVRDQADDHQVRLGSAA